MQTISIMPEVIEVAWTCNYLQKYLGSYLMNIHKLDKQGFTINTQYLNEPINNIESKGKLLWFTCPTKYIHITFGLYGILKLEKDQYTRYILELKDTNDQITYIYYSDKLHFGKVEVNETNDKKNNLGPDLLKNMLTVDILKERLKPYDKKGRENTKIIKLLLDQSMKGIGSGLGIYLICEILYNAKINPSTPVKDIIASNDKMVTLTYSINYILRLAYMTNELQYFKKMSPIIVNYVIRTRQDIKEHPETNTLIDYCNDIDIDNSQFKFWVYKRNTDDFGNKVIKEEMVGRKLYYVNHTV